MPENYVLLERTELNAAAASVTFANIPQTGYTDLKIVVSARANNANIFSGAGLRFNADSAANYSHRVLQGDGASASSFTGSGGGGGLFGTGGSGGSGIVIVRYPK